MLRPFPRALPAVLVAVCAVGPTALAAAPAQAAGSAARTGTVRVSGTVHVRTGPSTTAASVGTLRDGARVKISCAVDGQRVRGTVRTTDRWDRLTSGRYVSHAFVRVAGAVPACRPAAVTGVVRTEDGAVRLRTGPSREFPANGAAGSGARLRLVCAAAGERVNGTVRSTAQWDRLADGRYVSHAYVRSPSLPRCAGTVPTAPAQLTPEQFIAGAAPGARKGWRQYGVPASVTIAQAILESGWGRSALSSSDRNYFGIKCFGDPGPIAAGCRVYETWECDKAGRCFTTKASFRTYANAADSYVDHGHFLRSNSRYKGAFRYGRQPDAFAAAIWKAGYATDPKYVAKLTGLMKSYDLYRFDP
ncbi:MAG TPA: sporangiospore maturation cell wall hydrolase GsmA [Micromonosporaceae bacterium]|nr:sporangiospore maturation cell wall hydrolase GsmA [Micromonosporaceae bacterium]